MSSQRQTVAVNAQIHPINFSIKTPIDIQKAFEMYNAKHSVQNDIMIMAPHLAHGSHHLCFQQGQKTSSLKYHTYMHMLEYYDNQSLINLMILLKNFTQSKDYKGMQTIAFQILEGAGFIGASQIYYACYFICECYEKKKYEMMLDYYPQLVEVVIQYRIYRQKIQADYLQIKYQAQNEHKSVGIASQYHLIKCLTNNYIYCCLQNQSLQDRKIIKGKLILKPAQFCTDNYENQLAQLNITPSDDIIEVSDNKLIKNMVMNYSLSQTKDKQSAQIQKQPSEYTFQPQDDYNSIQTITSNYKQPQDQYFSDQRNNRINSLSQLSVKQINKNVDKGGWTCYTGENPNVDSCCKQEKCSIF